MPAPGSRDPGAASTVSLHSLRSLIGPLVAALACWCASGTVTLAAADQATPRILLPAPAWIGLGGFVAACLVGPWRRHPITALPAVAAILPWLPMPLPAAALLWTGTLAWVPVVLAGVAALATVRRPVWRPGGAAGSCLLAGALAMAAGALVFGSLNSRLPGGDEPHYLVIAQSLLEDGDLRIGNQHDQRAYAAWWDGPLPPDFIERGRDGEIYSIHAPGLAVLVAPLFALGGVPGAQATILVFSGVAGVFTWLLAFMATGSRASAWFAWGAIAGSATMLVQGVTIFPDGPAAALAAAAAAIWLGWRQRRLSRRRWLALGAVLLTILPFLHTRLAILALGLGVLFLVELARDPQDRVRRVAAFVSPAALGALGWFGFFLLVYGSPDPTSPYGANRESSLTFVPGGMLGLLFDQQFGLFTFSPVLALALAGWWSSWRTGNAALRLLPVVVGYLAAVTTYWMWWAGVPATPARLATAVLPLLAPALALVWARGSVFLRTTAAALLVSTLAISAFVLAPDGELAWAIRGDRAEWLDALRSVADLPRAWPSFFRDVVGGDVTSEGPFVVHVLLVIAVAGAATWAAARLVRHAPAPVAAAMAATMLPGGLMLVAAGGWQLAGATGLRPVGSQVDALRRVGEGRSAWVVGSMTAAPAAGPGLPLVVTLTPRDVPAAGRVTWDLPRNLPAGSYVLEVTSSRPAGGHLIVTAGEEAAPVRSATLPSFSRHLVPLEFQTMGAGLSVTVDGDLSGAGPRIDLRPTGPGGPAPSGGTDQ